jgi:hypothetical protein
MATGELIFDFEYIFAKNRWDELEEYLSKTEKYLKEVEREFKAWVKEESKKFADAELDEWGEFYESSLDDYQRYSEGFPRILRGSFFVSVISLLEYEINMICERLKKEQEIEISWSDLRGDTLERAKLFFKLTGLDLTYSDQTWKEINNYYLVRNCIVHNRGLIKGFGQESKLRVYITQKNIISQDTIEQEIALTEHYCKEIIKTTWTFFNNIYSAYKAQKEKKNP